jgi:hypothetical protein
MTLWEFSCVRSGYDLLHPEQERKAPEMEDERLAALGIEGFS